MSPEENLEKIDLLNIVGVSSKVIGANVLPFIRTVESIENKCEIQISCLRIYSVGKAPRYSPCRETAPWSLQGNSLPRPH